MNYTLLTGATGLLGRYLLTNLLMQGQKVAVLIRRNRLTTARQRLETVLVEFEKQRGIVLPRPVVLDGNLHQAGLGLSVDDLAWSRNNIRTVLHNAASLSFESGERHEEPWVTNLDGTQNILGFARDIGVKDFHHVSTAYVCGRRRGVLVREHELNCGQEFGNDYEHSKLMSEELVHAASWLNSRTVYRPAIIVGDSQTGFTSTFHGFYTPLRIIHTIANSLVDQVDSLSVIGSIGLLGHERKNLVPVDWVADVITTLFADQKSHNRVYHVTPDQTTTVSRLCEVMDEALRKFTVQSNSATASSAQSNVAAVHAKEFLASFHNQMSVYRAYWSDDPTFDSTNRWERLPQLPCPDLNYATLLKLCRFAIESGFWSTRGNPIVPNLDLDAHWGARPTDANATTLNQRPLFVSSFDNERVNVRVLGCGGGDWQVSNQPGEPRQFFSATQNQNADQHNSIELSVDTLNALKEGVVMPNQVILSGAAVVRSDVIGKTNWLALLADLARGNVGRA